jgi:UDP-N-acetylglucosamine:LPS N-acetylglucosamine transferase
VTAASAAEPLSVGPARVLVLSAEMGEGHNAAAAALREAIAELWPDCRVNQLDTFRVAGRRLARMARWAYGFQLARLPWTYQVFYDALGRSPRLARALKAVLVPFFGARLESAVAASQADLIISTYPFGSAGLAWMVRQRGLRTPTATYIPAFHVHPLWVYPEIGTHFVMYDSAPEHAPEVAPTMRLGAPPVRRQFGQPSRRAARLELGLSLDAFVVLVTGGAWGLGDLDRSVRVLLELHPPVHVVAVCGKNEGLARELRRRPDPRLTVLDYVDTMPELMAAANVVVTNGAGVTVLEALRSRRPVIAFAPLVGHGRAATAEMVRRDLAIEASTTEDLARAVQALAADETLMHRLERAVLTWSGDRLLTQSVRQMVVDGVEDPGHRH